RKQDQRPGAGRNQGAERPAGRAYSGGERGRIAALLHLRNRDTPDRRGGRERRSGEPAKSRAAADRRVGGPAPPTPEQNKPTPVEVVGQAGDGRQAAPH